MMNYFTGNIVKLLVLLTVVEITGENNCLAVTDVDRVDALLLVIVPKLNRLFISDGEGKL